MLGNADLLETPPETHNQYLMDAYRENFGTTLELRDAIGHSEFKTLTSCISDIKARRRALLELVAITDAKVMNREIVKHKLSDAKTASRYAQTVFYIINHKLHTLTLEQLRSFTANNDDVPNNMYRVLGVYHSKATHKVNVDKQISKDGVMKKVVKRMEVGMLIQIEEINEHGFSAYTYSWDGEEHKINTVAKPKEEEYVWDPEAHFNAMFPARLRTTYPDRVVDGSLQQYNAHLGCYVSAYIE